jgi:hypothetical protein
LYLYSLRYVLIKMKISVCFALYQLPTYTTVKFLCYGPAMSS